MTKRASFFERQKGLIIIISHRISSLSLYGFKRVFYRVKGNRHFFWSETGVTSQFRIGSTHLAPKSHSVSGKEVVFFEMEWPGFEPRTSSIRRGRSIHSTTPHLALIVLVVGFSIENILVMKSQVGRGGVDRASFSDARGPGFEPRPLHLKKYHFFTRN